MQDVTTSDPYEPDSTIKKLYIYIFGKIVLYYLFTK